MSILPYSMQHIINNLASERDIIEKLTDQVKKMKENIADSGLVQCSECNLYCNPNAEHHGEMIYQFRHNTSIWICVTCIYDVPRSPKFELCLNCDMVINDGSLGYTDCSDCLRKIEK